MDVCGTCVKDIRSPSMPHKRAMKAKQKYYGYRSHHPSTVGQPYIAFAGKHSKSHKPFNTSPSGIPLVKLGDKTCIRIGSKRDLWLDRLYNIWPLRPPHHYGGCRGCHPILNKQQRDPKWAKNVRDKITDEVEAARVIIVHMSCCCSACAPDPGSGPDQSWDDLEGLGPGPCHPSINEETQDRNWEVERGGSAVAPLARLAEDLGFELIDVEAVSWVDGDVDGDEWSCIDGTEFQESI